MAEERAGPPAQQDAPTVLIRVTHIRDGQVLEVFEMPADAIQFDTQGS